ncbi:hypothetical protein LTR53_015564, partial [Teratosphaeriaceae sp. CCFEE 6253]
SIVAASEALYYEATNASSQIGIDIESPVAHGFLHSRAIWVFGVLIALVISRILSSSPKLPAGTKRLPQIPGA